MKVTCLHINRKHYQKRCDLKEEPIYQVIWTRDELTMVKHDFDLCEGCKEFKPTLDPPWMPGPQKTIEGSLKIKKKSFVVKDERA